MKISLEERFMKFLRTLPQAECIDELVLSPMQKRRQKGRKKADFLFSGRQIICELKRLASDPTPTLERIVENLSERDDWPVIMGSRSLSSVVRKLPDANAVEFEILHRLTNRIENAIQDANGQIRDTKVVFNTQDSAGFLVLLNEDIHLFSPQMVVSRVGRVLAKVTDTSTRTPRFPNVSAVLVVHTAHVQKESDNEFAFPMLAIRNPLSADPRVLEFVDELMPRWAEFEGMAAVRTDWRSLEIPFIPFREVE